MLALRCWSLCAGCSGCGLLGVQLLLRCFHHHKMTQQKHTTAASSTTRSRRVDACHVELLTDIDVCISAMYLLPNMDSPSSLVR
jgi:hypothetical protein